MTFSEGLIDYYHSMFIKVPNEGVHLTAFTDPLRDNRDINKYTHCSKQLRCRLHSAANAECTEICFGNHATTEHTLRAECMLSGCVAATPRRHSRAYIHSPGEQSGLRPSNHNFHMNELFTSKFSESTMR